MMDNADGTTSEYLAFGSDDNDAETASLMEDDSENAEQQLPNINNIKLAKELTEEEILLEMENATTLAFNPLIHQSVCEYISAMDFKILYLLGHGAFGRVFLVRKMVGHDRGTLYAMKVISKMVGLENVCVARHTTSEREVLEIIQGKTFLVNMHYAFQSETTLFLILDYVGGGEFFTHLHTTPHVFTERRVKFYIAQIVLALEILHNKNIIFRDIKLENIMLRQDGNIAITDFGLAKILNEKNGYRANSFCGTKDYMAPEILLVKERSYDYSVDWWALGILAYELLTGKTPKTYTERNGEYISIPIKMSSALSENSKDFLTKLLERDLSKRWGAQRSDVHLMKKHPFFKGINWEKLSNMKLKPALTPHLYADDDISYFSTEFTSLPAYIPSFTVPTMGNNVFRNFTYIAPQHWNHVRHHNANLMKILPCDSNLSLGKFVGRGSYGNCFKLLKNSRETSYVAKVVLADYLRKSEIDALVTCASDNHENLLSYICSYSDKVNIWIVTEFIAGEDLCDYLEKKKLNEKECLHIFRQLISALRCIHDNKFIHGDIKPENIRFVDNDHKTIKLTDFGNACHENMFKVWNRTPRYTLDYAAPELLEKIIVYSPAVDIYSAGATLYTMLVGHPPFRMNKSDRSHTFDAHRTVRKRIKKKTFNQDAIIWMDSTITYKQLVAWCLEKDPKKRPLLREIILSDYYNDRKPPSVLDILPILILDSDEEIEEPVNTTPTTANITCLEQSGKSRIDTDDEGATICPELMSISDFFGFESP